MFANLLLLAQRDPEFDPAAGAAVAGALGSTILFLVCILFFVVLMFIPVIAAIVGMWKVFEKAGHPGWAAIVPIYNNYIMTEIAGKDIMWFILMLVPCVNIVAMIVVNMDLAKNFGKDPTYGIGLALLPFVFYPMLGYSDAQYKYMRN